MKHALIITLITGGDDEFKRNKWRSKTHLLKPIRQPLLIQVAEKFSYSTTINLFINIK